MLKRIEARCGIENIHPHRFRRTLATMLARKGTSVQEAASILGHEQVDTTMKYVCFEKTSVKRHYQTIVALKERAAKVALSFCPVTSGRGRRTTPIKPPTKIRVGSTIVALSGISGNRTWDAQIFNLPFYHLS